MQIELNDEEREAVRRAVGVYVSDLREEIAKTEKHDMRVALHAEEEILNRVLARLAE